MRGAMGLGPSQHSGCKPPDGWMSVKGRSGHDDLGGGVQGRYPGYEVHLLPVVACRDPGGGRAVPGGAGGSSPSEDRSGPWVIRLMVSTFFLA